MDMLLRTPITQRDSQLVGNVHIPIMATGAVALLPGGITDGPCGVELLF
jgi:hypothetical protein